MLRNVASAVLLLSFIAVGGCGGSPGGAGGTGGRGGGSAGSGGTAGGSGGAGPADAGPDSAPGDVAPPTDRGTGGAGDAPVMPIPGTCSPPLDIEKPYEKLSQTGCMDPANPTRMAAIVVPYEVNSPLWSDSALKTRGMVLPSGKKIHVKDCAKNPAECCVIDNNNFPNCLPPADDGKWVFPVGTVLVKNFWFNADAANLTVTNASKLVETRLFIHVADKQWVGYGYRWNDAQTEATIVPDERVKATFTVGARMVEWNYPSRQDCMKCHTDFGGSSLGPETAQMNRMVGNMNQIDQLQALGLFETAPAKPYKAALVAPVRGQAGTPPASATLEQRARSYLHANCSFCHRPDGLFYLIDFRQDVSFLNTHVCNQMPDKGGRDDLKNFFPGDPMHSVMVLRMAAPAGDPGRMPTVGSAVVDPDGTKLMTDWITSVKTCP